MRKDLARIALVAVALALSSLRAHASIGALPIDSVVSRSVIVADATILSGRVVEYRYRDYTAQCGILYEARVRERFKGNPGEIVVFASNLELGPGTRHLLFISEYEGDFPSDSHIYLESEDDPDFGPAVEKARRDCIAGLPLLKSSYLHHGRFVPRTLEKGEQMELSAWVGGAPGLMQDASRSEWREWRVDWARLRAWLLANVPELVDFSRPRSTCDAACVTRETEAARAVMLRQQVALRELGRQQPRSATALDAAQAAWARHAEATCGLLAAGSGTAATPAGTCRLDMTVTRARSLWQLRQHIASGDTESSCDDACLAGELREAVWSIDDFLADLHVAHGNAAAIDSTQRIWNEFVRAHCAAALAISAGAAPALRDAACRLYATRERMGELQMIGSAVDERRRRTREAERPSP